jgi:formamidopyrimidine-DNA glycosylase
MPELPDITIYIEALEERILGKTLVEVAIGTPFLLRSVAPPVSATQGKKVRELRRVGKRIAIGLESHDWLVLHLMIAGRLHWKASAAKPAGRNHLALFLFENGALTLTEAGSQRRASLHVVRGEEGLRAMDPGGLEVLTATAAEFGASLTASNHTLKRALTDPRTFSGIGNSYSDEILFRAQLSPVLLTQRMTAEQITRLYTATRESLTEWVALLREQMRGKFPEKVTAFRPEMAVHGKFNEPCPRCGAKIQRIQYASNETNYCATCQTGGKLLADRGLSRLMRDDWPRTLEELEALKRA